MDGLLVIFFVAWVALTGVYWWIYHKFFHVMYFGSVSKALSNEFITAGILSCITLVFLSALLGEVFGFVGWVFGGVLTLVSVLLKIVLVVIAIGAVGGLIYYIVNKFKKNQVEENQNEDKDSAS